MDAILAIMQTVAVFILVLVACYWCTKKLAKMTAGAEQSKYIKIIDRIMLGKDKYIGIIQTGQRYFLVSITVDKIQMLKELKEEDLVELSTGKPSSNQKDEFKKILDRIKKMDGRQNE